MGDRKVTVHFPFQLFAEEKGLFLYSKRIMRHPWAAPETLGLDQVNLTRGLQNSKLPLLLVLCFCASQQIRSGAFSRGAFSSDIQLESSPPPRLNWLHFSLITNAVTGRDTKEQPMPCLH